MMWKFVKWNISGSRLGKAMCRNGAWKVFTLILKLNIMVYQHVYLWRK